MANNISSSSTDMLITPTIHVIINIISLIATVSGTCLSFVILTGLLLRKKTFRSVPLLLCTNNYILVFFLGIFELIHNIDTLRGDFGLVKDGVDIHRCRIQAYIVFSLLSAVYLACVLQAIFRLCRIAYPTLLWLLNPHTYLMIIPLMWIFSYILVSPLYIRYAHRVIPGEYICRITKDDTFSIVYSTTVIYGIPFNVLAFTYFQVHRFMYRQTLTIVGKFHKRSRRRQRDIFVFRRIIIIVTLLGSYGMPNSIMLIILAMTGRLVSSFYRVLELSFSAIVLTLSIALLYATPQLREKIRFRSQRTPMMVVLIRDETGRQGGITHCQSKTTAHGLRMGSSQ